MENVPLILRTTQAIGDFLIGAVHDTMDATATGIGAIPGQVVDATKYALGVDRFVGEDRPWSKIGTGFRGDFWDGDNGLTRFAERFNHTVFSVVLGGVNTITGGLTYEWVNRGLGIDCPYFFPGPQDARELGQFFSSGLAMMLMGRQLLRAPSARIAAPVPLPVPPDVIIVEQAPRVAIGPFRPYYAVPSAVEEVAAHIRNGNVVAPSILRRMLDLRSPQLLDSVARTTVTLLRDGHLPMHLLETIIWDTHPRTLYLVQHLNEMRAGSPRLQAIWRHLKLDAYQLEVLPGGDAQLMPFQFVERPMPLPRPTQVPPSLSPETYN